MTVATTPFLEFLKSATVRADADEKMLREEFSQRLKSIEQDRAFAYRCYNLMSAIADGVADAEREEIAVAQALAVLRTRLGWHSDSEPRSAILSSFAPVGRTVFFSLAPPEADWRERLTTGGDIGPVLEAWFNSEAYRQRTE